MHKTMNLHTKQDYQHPKTTIFSIDLGGFIALSYKLKEDDKVNIGSNNDDEGTDMQLTRRNDGFHRGLWE